MNKSDEKILVLMQEIKNQKEEIAKAEARPNWKTSCRLPTSHPNSSFGDINLHVENDLSTLIYLASFLQEKEESYKKAAVLLNVIKAPEFKWGGFSVNEWLHDIKIKINKNQIKEKKQKLESLEKRLHSITSAELRAELELKLIEEELKQ